MNITELSWKIKELEAKLRKIEEEGGKMADYFSTFSKLMNAKAEYFRLTGHWPS